MQRLAPFFVLLLLAACSSTIDSVRANIRGWCVDNPDYCDRSAVK